MPASACPNTSKSPSRRSLRLKNIHRIYEDSDGDPTAFKRVKTEVIDPEEVASPLTLEQNIASVGDKDGEQDCHNVSLKDLRDQCKAKNRKTSKITLVGCGIKDQTKIKEESDLDTPLIALKQKRPKNSPAKANKKMDELMFSPCSAKIEDTTSQIDETLGPAQSTPLKGKIHDPALENLGTGSTDLEQSKIATDCIEEIGEQICYAGGKNAAGVLVSCGKPNVLCETEIKDTDHSDGFGTSSCSIQNPERSSFVLQQELMEGDERIPQSCFMNQPTQLADVSDHFCEQACSIKENSFDDITAEKETEIVSSLGFIDEMINHQEASENITSSDMDNSSVVTGLLVYPLSQSCHDRTDNNEYWNEGVIHVNELESVKILEDLSPLYESSTDIQSDLCGSTEMNYTSLEEVVQMQAEGQLDSVCCGVRPKNMVLDMETGRTTTDCTFAFDKPSDLAQPANFVAQDGRLESIVYDALNNPAHRMTSENKSSVGLPHTVVFQSSVIEFTDSCPEGKKASDDKISFPDNVEWPLKDKLNSTIDYGIPKSVNNEGSEELVLQHELFQSCTDKFNLSGVIPNISNTEESQILSAVAPNSSATSLETDVQIKKSKLFIDEESIEENSPKILLSKRKIMSPTSQEKLCNALTGIDLCDSVQRLKRAIIIEDCHKPRKSLSQPAHKQDRSMFSTYKRLNGRTSVSPTSKGVLKSTGSPPHQQTTCSCMRSSPMVLDTEKAVEFSQRQMHDIENIAAKLIRSLKHMKSIVDESLLTEAYSLLPNCNIAEIRAASEDALEVEKTTRKWLSIMNKDCNRFCKILSLAKKSVVSHPEAHSEAPRKQRRITFADEAGGMLCHVKVYKDGQISLISE